MPGLLRWVLLFLSSDTDFFPLHFLRGVGGKELNRPFQKVSMHGSIYLRKPRCFRNSLLQGERRIITFWGSCGRRWVSGGGYPGRFFSDGFNALQGCGWVWGGPGIPPSELAQQALRLHSLLWAQCQGIRQQTSPTASPKIPSCRLRPLLLSCIEQYPDCVVDVATATILGCWKEQFHLSSSEGTAALSGVAFAPTQFLYLATDEAWSAAVPASGTSAFLKEMSLESQ